MHTLPMPERCLTLLPPWPQAIRYAGKRLENRSSGAGKGVAQWRNARREVPIIGLSQSKNADKHEIDAATMSMHRQGLISSDSPVQKYSEMERGAAKLWLAAELLEVLPPDRCEGDPWHVPSQWGLILGRIWEVKPVPCMGGQGLWRSQWCNGCKKIVADSHGLTCKTCLSKLVSGPECPALEIVAEVLL